MQDVVFPFVGGLGLFLIGMMLLSEGLVAFGGEALKRALARFTGTPATAFVSGTLATVVVQSSSATTVTLIGFVSAGLISFSQAVGVLIGASLGNTATGWIVAGLGLKVNLGLYTMPLIGAGALLKLMSKGRSAALGMALAGFGMMFVGLNALQDGMRGVTAVFNLADLPMGGYEARMLTMLFGLALTAVLQSSSAAIATTLTALHTATINFEQASALVVGAAIGTTLTGVLATIGGTIHAKRTALAYVLFNAVAGVLAIVLLPLLFWVIDWLGTHAGLDPGATSLAAFHTLFIGLGVVLFLPLVPQFAALVERLLPEKDEGMHQRLDDSLLAIPAVALEAAQRALEGSAQGLLQLYGDMLTGVAASPVRLHEIRRSLHEEYRFVSRIELSPDDHRAVGQRIAQLHATDHLLRFHTRLNDMVHANIDLTAPDHRWALDHSQRILHLATEGLATLRLPLQLPDIELHAVGLTTLSQQMRHALLEGAATAPGLAADVLAKADAYRWLERTGHHVWRIAHYLSQAREPAAQTAPPPGSL